MKRRHDSDLSERLRYRLNVLAVLARSRDTSRASRASFASCNMTTRSYLAMEDAFIRHGNLVVVRMENQAFW